MSEWISVDKQTPVNDKYYWHCHQKYDGSFTPVYRGIYMIAFNLMRTDNSTMSFTHFMESEAPHPPEAE